MSFRPFAPAAVCAAGLLCLSAFDLPGIGQEDESADPPAETAPAIPPQVPNATDEGERPGQDVYPRRLPAGYGAVGLSREQKERVYAIQAKYDDRIEELLDEIAAIKTKQDAEIAGVLTAGQREFLTAWEKQRDAEREAAREQAEENADAGQG